MENTELLFRIAGLIAREKIAGLNPEEEIVLRTWVEESDKNRQWYNSLKDDKRLAEEILQLDSYNDQRSFKTIAGQLASAERKMPLLRRVTFYRYAAAVAFLIAGVFVVLTLTNKHHSKQVALSKIQPGTQKAVLTTSDNLQIILGSHQAKSEFSDGNMLIVDTGSVLTYITKDKKSESEKQSVVAYNQIETPRGGEYNVILPDGTEVKLNSQTRLRFPVQFDKTSREVELDGEAFFDVKHSEETAFIVNTGHMKITVYGTSFNVSAYSDDGFIQTTLVRGSVGISLPGDNTLMEYKLVPGQQAYYNKKLDLVETKEVDVQQYIAWTSGLFVFKNEPLELILQKLARWYDCDIEFSEESLKKEAFTGELKRFDSFSTILEMISIASDVAFKIENKKVIVVKEK